MNDKVEQLDYWLLLNRIPQLGSVAFNKLMQSFCCVEEIFQASTEQLQAVGLPLRSIVAITNPDWQSIAADLQWLQQPNHHILTLEDADYPLLLKETAYPPLLLYIAGDTSLLNQPQLAMVGSRNPSVQGKEIAFSFAHALVATGLVITSGLAWGIDSASHQGALANKGKTIAVVGTGLDIVYPKQNQVLAEQIASYGAIVSEFPVGVAARAENFPRRNRLISGLSLGVLVVEAALRSGSLITARYAAEQGRDIFAIPGSIHNPLSKGCHSLLQQGAKLIQNVQDILDELQILDSRPSVDDYSELLTPQTLELDQDYQTLLACFDDIPNNIDTLMLRSDLPMEQLSSMLLRLELEGYINKEANGYIRVSGSRNQN